MKDKKLAFKEVVVLRKIKDKQVLVDISNNRVFSINGTGFSICEQIIEKQRVDVDYLAEQYQVPTSVIEADVVVFIDFLKDSNLLEESFS